MRKADLIQVIASRSDLSKAAAGRALDAALDAIADAVANGDTVSARAI